MATIERRDGKTPVTTVYVPDLEVPVPTKEDLLRAAYARDRKSTRLNSSHRG